MTASSPLVCIEEVRVYTPQIQVGPLAEIRHEVGDALVFNLSKNIQEPLNLWVLNTANQDSILISSSANFTDSTAFVNPLGVFTYNWIIPSNYSDGSYLLIARSTLDNSIVGRGANFFIGECIEDINTGEPILFEEETLLATEFLCFNNLIPGPTNADDVIYNGILLGDATILAYDALTYINSTAAETLPPANYPVPFGNLQADNDGEPYYDKARALLYLHYDDAHSAMPRNWYYFPAQDSVTKGLAVRILMETFDVRLNPGTNNVFPDVENHPYADWINYAHSINLITEPAGSNFNPDTNVTKEWFYKYLFRIMVNYNLNTYVQLAEPKADDFYTPGNYSPEAMPFHLGMTDGIMNYSGDSPISIPGAGMTIGFSFGYSSVQTDLPIEFFKEPHLANGYDFEPLGAGWSHNYNARILHREDPSSGEERYIFVSPGGRTLTYDPNSNNFDAPSIYDDIFIDQISGMITITTNSIMTYKFEKDPNADHYNLFSIMDRYNNIISLDYTVEPITGLRQLSEVEESNGLNKHITMHYSMSNPQKLEKVDENFYLLTVKLPLN